MSNNVKMFHEMGIDDRILEGISSVKWKYPTRVQEMAIPFVLEGKTVIAEARTGSGKSGAFLIPCLHRILLEKNTAATQNVRMLILAPTKELCRQISCMAQQLTTACTREIKVLDLSPNLALDEQKSLLDDLPDVVIGPPRRILAHVTQGNLDISEILSVVVDEADLMLAFQHKDALDELWKYLPPLYQSFITSATLGKNMEYIKSFLAVGAESMKELTKNIVILRLKETPLPATSQLNHYVIKLEKFEKAVLLLHIFKNKLLTGKTIIFVNSITMAYRLRMFLGQFAIPTCILNSELPANTRCDIIEQFNSGTFETIIAADGDVSSDVMKGVDVDNESGTSRGLDFQFVSNIINFDFPETTVSYIHRVGRTARIGNQGTALNMVSMDQQDSYKKILKELNELMEVSETSKKNYEGIFKKFSFDIKDYDVIRYRAEDPWWSCSNTKILCARKREICQQLLNSKKLESHFRANPFDRSMLRHEKYQHGIKTQGNLKNLLPSYNMADKPEDAIDEDEVPKKKKKQEKITKGSKKMGNKLHRMKPTKNMKKKKRQMKDPLKKLQFSGFKK